MSEMDRLFQALQATRKELLDGQARLSRELAHTQREQTAAHIRLEDKLGRRFDDRENEVDRKFSQLGSDLTGLKLRLAGALGIVTSLIGVTGHSAIAAIFRGLS